MNLPIGRLPLKTHHSGPCPARFGEGGAASGVDSVSSSVRVSAAFGTCPIRPHVEIHARACGGSRRGLLQCNSELRSLTGAGPLGGGARGPSSCFSCLHRPAATAARRRGHRPVLPLFRCRETRYSPGKWLIAPPQHRFPAPPLFSHNHILRLVRRLTVRDVTV